MITLEEAGLTYLIVVKQWWGTDRNLKTLKLLASRNGKFPKGKLRKYHCFLVHHETVIEDGKFVFTSELAAEAALDMGNI